MRYKNPISVVLCISLVYTDPIAGRKIFAISQNSSCHFFVSEFSHERFDPSLLIALISSAMLSQIFLEHFLQWPFFTTAQVSHVSRVFVSSFSMSTCFPLMTVIINSLNSSFTIFDAFIAKIQFSSSGNQLKPLMSRVKLHLFCKRENKKH